ncbi:MFS transporter [Parabacteroides distasonis]|jgi:Fucose permease|uniref:MFS transporter n=1 Tax=Parabacteroides distasonis TaxID=823 RepID=UPI001C3911AF|nr:MFS transporter [Parabacteroides distasonis]MBV4228099.1 MFS transporter [Parabacteroides distasonis]
MEIQVKKNTFWKLPPVLFAFFVMGFVDVVGVSTSYVKSDFGLNDTLANLLPMLVFLWFAVCSLPTGLLMKRIGRKNTVLLSSLITIVAMVLPLVYYSFFSVLLAFALLGIGNTVLQVSLNPLLMDVVAKEKVTSLLTFGYFIKAISSTLGPVILSVAVGVWGDWHLVFWVYAVCTSLSWIWLVCTPIQEKREEVAYVGGSIWKLFKNRKLMVAFSVILLIVGFEIGLMTAVPKYLLERCQIPIEQGGLGCSLYFAARTLGTFIGSIILSRYSSSRFLIINMVLALLAFGLFMVSSNSTIVLAGLFLVGLFCANVFPIIFSSAIQSEPSKADEISALMIMGVAGGAILPVFMGGIADVSNQFASLFVPLLALVYILGVSVKMR